MSTSTNPITQESYKLPVDLDDSVRIKDFLQKNYGKKVVVVQGLSNRGLRGYLSMSREFAKALWENSLSIFIPLVYFRFIFKLKQFWT